MRQTRSGFICWNKLSRNVGETSYPESTCLYPQVAFQITLTLLCAVMSQTRVLTGEGNDLPRLINRHSEGGVSVLSIEQIKRLQGTKDADTLSCSGLITQRPLVEGWSRGETRGVK